MARRCPECGRARDSVLTTSLSGAARSVAVEMIDLPYRSCADDHARVYAYPDFGSDLAELVFYGGIPQARRTRVPLSRRERCLACGSELPGTAEDEPREFRVHARLGEAPPFDLLVRAPAVACGGCGAAQVRATTFRAFSGDLADAMIAAFDSGGVRPA